MKRKWKWLFEVAAKKQDDFAALSQMPPLLFGLVVPCFHLGIVKVVNEFYRNLVGLRSLKRTIATDSSFDAVTYDNNADSWMFNFNDNISLFAATLWRLLKDDQIILVSADNGQQFGLPKPVDAVSELSGLLTGQKLTNIKIKKNTADIILTLTAGYVIEIFISSGGYESYNLHTDNKQYIGMGMGDIAIFSNGQ